MIYLSIDIETSGLDENKHKLLEFGAIIEDTSKNLSFDEIPKFRAILPYEEINGSPFALTINKEIIEIISAYNLLNDVEKIEFGKKHSIIHPENLPLAFFNFLDNNGLTELNIPVAGKNFGTFDKKFIDKVFYGYENFYHRRFIDPAIFYLNFRKDNYVPSLSDCKKRAMLNPEVQHKSLNDAWDVIELLRKKY